MVYVDQIRNSGTRTWCHLTADEEKTLQDMARRLRLPIKRAGGKGRSDHLDLTPHQRVLAIRYGAQNK